MGDVSTEKRTVSRSELMHFGLIKSVWFYDVMEIELGLGGQQKDLGWKLA